MRQNSNPNVRSLSSVLPTSWQRRLTFGAIALLLVIYGLTIPFATTELPQISGFLQITLTLIFVTNLITATLILAQYTITRSIALLVLANGYLFSSLIMIPYAMTFPNTFSIAPLLGTGIQCSPLLFNVWHFGFLIAVLCYTLLKSAPSISARYPIALSISLTVGVVCIIAAFVAIYSDHIPRFLLDDSRLTPLGHYAPGFVLILGLIALLVLWRHRSSVLDQSLMVVVCAIVLELSLVTFLIVNRNSVGAYTVRLYSAVAATVVLAALLAENTRLYAAVARTNLLLERERENKLMNLEAMAASITHEVRQPLAAVAANAGAALRFLGRAKPDLDEVKTALTRISNDSHRVSGIFDNLRALFGRAKSSQDSVDVNKVVVDALGVLRRDLADHSITSRVHLTSDLPLAAGHAGQLQEVIFNLVRNAIEAMSTMQSSLRVLQVETAHQHGKISVTVEDSGPGIDPEKLDKIFDAFVTTKRHGTGLGLAICRMIIERHEGQLSVAPAHPNGVVFQVVLPRKGHLAG
jgi:signal transduction histidine kinase